MNLLLRLMLFLRAFAAYYSVPRIRKEMLSRVLFFIYRPLLSLLPHYDVDVCVLLCLSLSARID
jgi:hypothetical protein